MRKLATLALLLLIAAPVLGIAGPAAAHADLDWTSPAEGKALKACPADVVMHFSEAVATGGLTATTGTVVLNARPTVDDQTFLVQTQGHCQAHHLALGWRTISADDGHVASGMVDYRIGLHRSPAMAVPILTTAVTPFLGSQQATVTLRALGYTALAAFIGGLVFLGFAWPAGAEVRSARIVLVGSVLLGALTSLGDLYAAAARTTASYDIRAALDQPFGREFAAMALVWLLAGVVVVDLLQRGRTVLTRVGWRISAAVAGGALIFLEGRSAHASQAAAPAWGTAGDFLHVACMSIWVGGLLMLVVCVLPRRRIDELDEVVPRFSTVAQIAVVGVIASGLLLVSVVLAPVPDIWGTHYARVLALKVLLLGVALGAAMFSKRWVDRRTSSRGRLSVGVRGIALSVGAEAVLAIGVLAAAGTLVSSSPGL